MYTNFVFKKKKYLSSIAIATAATAAAQCFNFSCSTQLLKKFKKKKEAKINLIFYCSHK